LVEREARVKPWGGGTAGSGLSQGQEEKEEEERREEED
jgi:hypothetical protein